MKRSIRCITLTLILIFSSFPAVHGQVEPIDLILILDTSSGMSSSYNAVTDYITSGFLGEFLRMGDTFHLIPFSSRPRLDISRRIEGRSDVETIIGRILLQHPLERGSDIYAALNFAESHINSLPAGRSKKIVLVSDNTAQEALVDAARTRLEPRGVTLDFVRVIHGQPLANLPVAGRNAPAMPPVVAAPAPAAPEPAVTLQVPVQTAEGAAVVETVEQIPQPPVLAEAAAEISEEAAVQEEIPVSAIQPVIIRPGPIEQQAITPERITAAQQQRGGFPVNTFLIITLIGICILAGLQLFASPRSSKKDVRRFKLPSVKLPSIKLPKPKMPAIKLPKIKLPEVKKTQAEQPLQETGFPAKPEPPEPAPIVKAPEPVLPVSAPPPVKEKNPELFEYAAIKTKQQTIPLQNRSASIGTSVAASALPASKAPIFLNLFVEDQSTAIGRRNIHSAKPGASFTVGGGKSDFLIFLVSLPPAIGKIRREGNVFKFIPLKPKFFPDLGANELDDCVNKTIRIITERKYEVRIRFEHCENPMEKLNSMVHLIRIPGLRD